MKTFSALLLAMSLPLALSIPEALVATPEAPAKCPVTTVTTPACPTVTKTKPAVNPTCPLLNCIGPQPDCIILKEVTVGCAGKCCPKTTPTVTVKPTCTKCPTGCAVQTTTVTQGC